MSSRTYNTRFKDPSSEQQTLLKILEKKPKYAGQNIFAKLPL